MNKEQAIALNDLINTDTYSSLEDDAAILAKLNTEPMGERLVTGRTLAAELGAVEAMSLIRELEQTGETLQGGNPEQALLGDTVIQAASWLRDTSQGLDIASPQTLTIIDQLAAANPSGPIATNQTALLSLVPTRAKKLLGRDAVQGDLDAARDVGEAKAAYGADLASAKTTYDAAVAAAL